ncbi:unnamed protein product [Tilletia laevis]|uniref:Uncharacterized protein n=3 Tax=Tilletia TaxID=13289 RepID=A0A8X7SWE6_9BASI|nr:hypothetical protein CF336_g4702 [Tilletia laevis]KAE8194369.1 hypothetical protein CF328_g4770 [Tilletia controversa]KAE8256997.1 hypothetical protein A4X03_0g4843 [Tilletia caries]KAE8196109.1 hypothetical protein CF335_g4942 [Tilletia laevis]KAE8246149.1 hypothetical protein A4X06_0g5155 [Tilletia controversa]
MAARFLADAESSHAKHDYYGSFLFDQIAMAILLRLYRLHADKHKAVVALTWEKQLYRSIDMHTSITRSKGTDPNNTPALALLALKERAKFWNQMHGDFLTTSGLAQFLMKSTERLLDKENKGWRYWVVAALDQHADYLRQSEEKGDCTHAVQVTKDAVGLFKSLYEEDALKWREDYAGALFMYTNCLLGSDQKGDSARAVRVGEDAVELCKTLYEEDAEQWRGLYAAALMVHAKHLSESGQEGDSARAVQVSKEAKRIDQAAEAKFRW